MQYGSVFLKIQSLGVFLTNISDFHWFGEEAMEGPHPTHLSNYYQQASRCAAEEVTEQRRET